MKIKKLEINHRTNPDGFSIIIKKKDYKVKYPVGVWNVLPQSVKKALIDNLVFANTHFLPLILQKEKISYDINPPILESFLFKNQLYDLLFCEKTDGKKHLEYLRRFYNLEFEFCGNDANLVDQREIPKFPKKHLTAIIPFTFGKESLATLGLCLELGINPVLVYVQEPTQPYEEKYKRKKLTEISQKFGVDTHFIKNDPGLFRYGQAFGKKYQSEIGWGSQTTILALMMIPFIFRYRAEYIFFGSEFSNNEYELAGGWKRYLSYDQTSSWTLWQNNMVRMLTDGQCGVYSSLEPLEEINIFYLLHHRYSKLGKYQFSCMAEKPIHKNSSWCHTCYKCSRMFLFSECCQIDPLGIGFKKNLLKTKGLFNNYFGDEFKSGSSTELDFSFYILHQRNYQSPYLTKFKDKKMAKLKSWKWYRKNFTKLESSQNLPPKYKNKMLEIFQEELEAFKKILP